MRFSIITVCFNAATALEKSIKSVLNQTFEDYELIIIDGASKDNTLEVVEQYVADNHIRFFSERDYGIYNAMNRGISRAGGDFVYFLNAGDVFVDCDVLKNVNEQIDSLDSIYYGTVQSKFGKDDLRLDEIVTDEDEFKRRIIAGWMPCHQSIFAPLSTLRNHYFNESYKIRADYEWLIYSYVNKRKFRPINIIIANFDVSGLSSDVNKRNMLNDETRQIFKEYQSFFYESDDELQKVYDNACKERDINFTKYEKILKICTRWLTGYQSRSETILCEKIEKYNNIAVYGGGLLGIAIANEIQLKGKNVSCILDRNATNLQLKYPTYKLDKVEKGIDLVVVSILADEEQIKREINKYIECDVILAADLFM